MIAGTAISFKTLSSTRYLLFDAEPIDESLPWYGIIIDIEKLVPKLLGTDGLTLEMNTLSWTVQLSVIDNLLGCIWNDRLSDNMMESDELIVPEKAEVARIFRTHI